MRKLYGYGRGSTLICQVIQKDIWIYYSITAMQLKDE